MNPRRSVSVPSCRSANIARTPSARPTSWPMTTPPSAGDRTTVGRRSRDSLGDGPAERLGVRRVLQHQRALQVPGAVQPGGQAEVAFEQGARSPEQIEQFVSRMACAARVVYNSGLGTEPPRRDRLLIRTTVDLPSMEPPSMRYSTCSLDARGRRCAHAAGCVRPDLPCSPPPPQVPSRPPAAVRRLSVDDAVKLALEQNLGIRSSGSTRRSRTSPIAQARASGRRPRRSASPTTRPDNPATNALAGGQTKDHRRRFATSSASTQMLPTGANYSVWPGTTTRSTTDQLLQQLQPAAALEPGVQRHAAAAAQLQRSTRSASSSRSSRRCARASDVQLQRDDVPDHAQRQERLLGSGLRPSKSAAQRQSLDLAQRAACATTRSACRSAPWRRSTSSRRSRRWRGTRRR